MIHIRLAQKEDLKNIMPLYTYAKKFMAANGNTSQWSGHYPASEDILKDIANGNYYVCTPDDEPDKIVGGFAFIIGKEPNYTVTPTGLTARFTGLPPTAKPKVLPEPALISAAARLAICALIPTQTTSPCKKPSTVMASATAELSMLPTAHQEMPMIQFNLHRDVFACKIAAQCPIRRSAYTVALSGLKAALSL